MFNQQRVVNSTHNGSLDCLKPMKLRMSEKKKKELKQKLDYVEMPASQPDAAVATKGNNYATTGTR